MATQWEDGKAYNRMMGRWSRQLAPRFVRWARLPAGGSVLDVGCGTGSLSAALAEAGMRRVVGVDPSPDFVAHAAATVGSASNGVTFQVGDALGLPAADREFDASASSLVLTFVPDPRVAVAEMRRVVREDGVVAACVWDYARGMGLTRTFWDVAVTLDLPGARERDEGHASSIARPDRLRGLFEDAGLQGVETGAIDLPMVFRDFHDYWTPFLGGQGPIGGFVAGLAEGDRDRLRAALERGLPRGPEGSIPLTCRAWAVRGVRR